MSGMAGVDVFNRARLSEVWRAEAARFTERTPRSRALQARAQHHMPLGVPMPWMAGLWRTPPIYIDRGDGASFTDIDGNSYLDFNLCDLSLTIGYGNAIVADAAHAQALRGTHFLLPTENAVLVSEMLSDRTRVPHWQYTLSASGSNTEVIRIARFMTGRQRIVIFAGHYHGHIEETLVRAEEGHSVPETIGLSSGSAAHTTILPFNDLEALERTLALGDVALVLTEPVMTNCNIVMPETGFHEGLRALTRRYGTLLCIDEAHTFQFAYGGLTRAWKLDPDFLVLGKGFGSGVAFSMYGMTDTVGRFVEEHLDSDVGPRGISLGGTTYGSALAMTIARALLEQVLTESAYESVVARGQQLADGLERIFQRLSLPWTAFRCGPRSGFCLQPQLPRTGPQSWESLDYDFIDARRVYLANRGVWDAVGSAGPQASFAHTVADINRYLAVVEEFLTIVCR
jgi:glutamate-1-semialdehyde 2,1-aminomutase